jgi:hypothetical protein
MKLDELLFRLKARRSGRGFVARCPAHRDRSPSLGITLLANRIIWLKCFNDCDVQSICDALGIQVRDLFCDDTSRNGHSFTDRERKEYAYETFWRPSRSATGTVAETYLRNRGITIRVPPSLRFTKIICRDYHSTMRWPALITGIQDVSGKFCGVAITVLCADGSDKAPIEVQKRIHGPFASGAVRLSSEVATRIAIGEGTETMLTVQEATGIPCWAALTASNLVRIRLPAMIREVIICTDNDGPGEAGSQALEKRLTREGRIVRIARPKDGAKDFNEMTL